MNILDPFEALSGISFAIAKACRDLAGSIAGECTLSSKRIAMQAKALRDSPALGCLQRWKIPASILASAFLVASCIGSGQTSDSRGLTQASASDSDTQTAQTITHDEAPHPPTADPSPATEGSNDPDSTTVEITTALGSTDGRASAGGTSTGGRRVSLRPKNNVDADDLLDHWGHRPAELLSRQLSKAPEPNEDVAEFKALLEAARRANTGPVTPDLQEDDTMTVLGHRRGVTYGRWSGGAADTLSIDFDYQGATSQVRYNKSFRVALERAGKAWSRRIADTWAEWERSQGDYKVRLIGDYGLYGTEIRVGPGGETSTGLVIYVTGVELAATEAGRGGPHSLRPGSDWEPHTGTVAFDNDFIEEAEEASLFRTMVHEIGHVLGSWYGVGTGERLESYIDRETGTWIGPNVVAVYGGPAPFQDNDDSRGWYDGERKLDATNFDYAHAGVCESVMAYCGQSAGIPAFQPAEIDFAFLADLGLTIKQATDRPETYGFAGWMDHAAFTLSVSRELEVSLADPQPLYSISGARFESLDTVDVLWAEADAFGDRSTHNLATSFPLGGTVRYSGGLIGTAIEYPGFPPVYGAANLSIGLDSLTGKASFTSLGRVSNGTRYLFGGGSLHYPITVEDNAITHDAPGASLVADFYGPGHEEVAGTLDDSRAGLLASFGAMHDERPDYLDVLAGADHVRGIMYQDGFSETADGWRRFRCGAGSSCEGKFEWWEAGSAWYDVPASGGITSRERVLDWTAGWGDWLSEDMFADHGGIRVARRYADGTDGGTGRYQEDGYFGTMEYAAFGTGFVKFHDWKRQDGDIWNFYILGTGFQGDRSGTRPAGGATWDGRMIGYQGGLEHGEQPFVQGNARVNVSFQRDQVDIDFSRVTSTDFKRSLSNFGFDNVPLMSDGAFDGFDAGNVEGAFFGPAHQEVAGMFQKNDNHVTGSFGAVKPD